MRSKFEYVGHTLEFAKTEYFADPPQSPTCAHGRPTRDVVRSLPIHEYT